MKSSFTVVCAAILLALFGSFGGAESLSDAHLGRLQLSTLLQNSVGKILSEVGHRAKRQTIYDITTQDVVDCISSTTEYQCGSSGYSQRVVDIALACTNDSYARNTANTCARNADGDTCGAVTLKFLSDLTYAETCAGAVASGTCHPACRSFLESAKRKLGCCVNAYVNQTDYPLYEQYEEYVDYRLWDLCGVVIPTEKCKDGGLNLKVPLDRKICSPQELISRFVQYECSKDVGQSLVDTLMKNNRCYIFSSIMVDACSSDDQGKYCAEALGTDIITNVVKDPLVTSINSHCFPGSDGCSPSCQAALKKIKESYRCCVNVYNDTAIGLELPSLSHDVWKACGIESPGFCEKSQVIPPFKDTDTADDTEDSETTGDTVPPTPQNGSPVDTNDNEGMEEIEEIEPTDGEDVTPTSESTETDENTNSILSSTEDILTTEPTQSVPIPSTEDADIPQSTEGEPRDSTEDFPDSDEIQTTEPPTEGEQVPSESTPEDIEEDIEMTEQIPTELSPEEEEEEEEEEDIDMTDMSEPTEPTPEDIEMTEVPSEVIPEEGDEDIDMTGPTEFTPEREEMTEVPSEFVPEDGEEDIDMDEPTEPAPESTEMPSELMPEEGEEDTMPEEDEEDVDMTEPTESTPENSMPEDIEEEELSESLPEGGEEDVEMTEPAPTSDDSEDIEEEDPNESLPEGGEEDVEITEPAPTSDDSEDTEVTESTEPTPESVETTEEVPSESTPVDNGEDPEIIEENPNESMPDDDDEDDIEMTEQVPNESTSAEPTESSPDSIETTEVSNESTPEESSEEDTEMTEQVPSEATPVDNTDDGPEIIEDPEISDNNLATTEQQGDHSTEGAQAGISPSSNMDRNEESNAPNVGSLNVNDSAVSIKALVWNAIVVAMVALFLQQL